MIRLNIFSYFSMWAKTAVVLLSFGFHLVLIVQATGAEVQDPHKPGGWLLSKPNPEPVVELQLEQLKVNQNKTSEPRNQQTRASASSKGILNLETPAVSDNSQPQPESFFSGGIDYDKVVSLSKDEPDKRKAGDSLEKSSTSLKIEMDYTPQDIAEYIFWTGDEPGVVSALNDFLQDDLVDKEDVIKFLEDVKEELKLLKVRYGLVAKQSSDNSVKFKDQKLSFTPFKGSQASEATPRQRDKRISNPKALAGEEAEYDELVQKTNQLNMKLREDFLRDIIYRLAKKLFYGELSENSLKQLSQLVAAAGQPIPKGLEKHILVPALVDFLKEEQGRMEAMKKH